MLSIVAPRSDYMTPAKPLDFAENTTNKPPPPDTEEAVKRYLRLKDSTGIGVRLGTEGAPGLLRLYRMGLDLPSIPSRKSETNPIGTENSSHTCISLGSTQTGLGHVAEGRALPQAPFAVGRDVRDHALLVGDLLHLARHVAQVDQQAVDLGHPHQRVLVHEALQHPG